MDIFQGVASVAKTVTTSPFPWEHWKVISETVKGFAEAFAFVATAGFFLYRLISGYFIRNLSLMVSCERRRSFIGTSDYLVVTAIVKKGDRGAVKLYDAIARVSTPLDPKDAEKRFAGTTRLTYKKQDAIPTIGETQSQKVPLLNLPPGDETMFSTFFEIQRDLPCVVEVVVLGGWRWSRGKVPQWRASQVSLPPKIQSEEAQVVKAGN